MTKHFGKNLLLGACLALGALTLGASRVKADSFNVTNNLSSGATNLTSWPTNAAGFLTGGPIGVANVKEANLDFQGLLVNTSATPSTVGFWVVYSQSQNPPTVVNGTNAWSNNQVVQLQNDWATNTAKFINVTLPALTTNWFHWSTNLPSTDLVAASTYVGIYQVTNNFTAGCFITNGTGNNLFTLTKKITTIKFP